MTPVELFLILSAIYAAPRIGPIFGTVMSFLCFVAAVVALVLRLP